MPLGRGGTGRRFDGGSGRSRHAYRGIVHGAADFVSGLGSQAFIHSEVGRAAGRSPPCRPSGSWSPGGLVPQWPRQGVCRCSRWPSPAGHPAGVEASLGLDRPARRLIQQGLRNEGFGPKVADGRFGPRTRAAIRGWQEAPTTPVGGNTVAAPEFFAMLEPSLNLSELAGLERESTQVGLGTLQNYGASGDGDTRR